MRHRSPWLASLPVFSDMKKSCETVARPSHIRTGSMTEPGEPLVLHPSGDIESPRASWDIADVKNGCRFLEGEPGEGLSRALTRAHISSIIVEARLEESFLL
jgi:hypothetical protein